MQLKRVIGMTFTSVELNKQTSIILNYNKETMKIIYARIKLWEKYYKLEMYISWLQ